MICHYCCRGYIADGFERAALPRMRRLQHHSLLRRPAARWMPEAFAGSHARLLDGHLGNFDNL